MSKDTKLVIYILQLKISCIHLGITKNHSKSFKYGQNNCSMIFISTLYI